jgi:hypothetical protein
MSNDVRLLEGVALRTTEAKIGGVVCSAARAGDDMIDGEFVSGDRRL